MTEKIRVAVIDPYPLFRDGVVHAIGLAADMTVVAKGSSADDAMRIASRCHVLLLEEAVPNNLSAVRTILRDSPDTRIFFLSAVPNDEHAYQALLLGVHGYLMKGITGADLVDALRVVHSGARQIASDLAWRLATQTKAVVSARRLPLVLSLREQQVLDQTTMGRTNAQMADILGLSVSSIKRLKTRIFRRMGVRNRMQAIVTANALSKTKPT